MTWSKEVSDWQRATFGKSTVARALSRAAEEFDELEDQAEMGTPESHAKMAEECADVCIVLCAVVALLGRDLATEIERKMAINRARAWELDGEGCGYHVK